MSDSDSQSSVRLDKWLWAARFFKTRALATEAVKGGHVHVGGERVKPSRALRVGDCVAVTKGSLRFEVVVQGVSDRRGPAAVAQTLYAETAASVAERERRAEERRAAAAAQPAAPEHRPDKRQRRLLRRLRDSSR